MEEARLSFACSSPEEDQFSASPSGRALGEARAQVDNSVYLAAFQASPVSMSEFPAGRTPALPVPFAQSPTSQAQWFSSTDGELQKVKHEILRNIATAGLADSAEEDEPDDELLSDDVRSEAYAFPSSDSDHKGSQCRTTATSASARSFPCSTTLMPMRSSSSWSQGTASTTATSKTDISVLADYKGSLRGSLEHQRDVHQALCSTAFFSFQCTCQHLGGEASCLDSGFDRCTLRSYHVRTYGRSPDFHTLRETKAAVHAAIWDLRKELPTPHFEGRLFEVPVWRLGEKVVCKNAFVVVTGGTPNAHREALTSTIAGTHPTDVNGVKAASQAIKSLQTTRSPSSTWATSWWKRHLMWHDWLPNEVKIQYRGPTWTIVYEQFYLPVATQVQLKLGRRSWMRSRKFAITELHNQFFPGITHTKLTVSRSARHSKFPECTECQQRRKTYKDLASNPRAIASQVHAAYTALVDHSTSWQKDRETALDLRHRYSVLTSGWRYSVDDKCGSFWQQLPVGSTGRDTKENAKDKYKFSVHANVVCGEQGHKQFTFVPKNISTGANFGLTNLLMTIFLAVKSGNLRPETDRFIRHTDGGPDNVSIVTHFIHWLLVYLGVFNEFIWFRFKAGHSHTEVADRLFSIIKSLFESDGANRVLPIDDFPSLIPKIEAAFKNEVESCTFNWNFANWDLRNMMQEMNVVSSSLKGISTKMVYRYTYDPELVEHGCVCVQYKTNISWKGDAREAEWSPIFRVEREMNSGDADDDAQVVECNVSKRRGVRFVTKPPDLRTPPRREPFDAKGEKYSPAAHCRAILNSRWKQLSSRAKCFWKCLMLFHSKAGEVAESVPDMPHTINTEEHSFTFDGSPRPFADVMKVLIFRFPRPFLPGDPFNTAPAETWEAAAAATASPRSQEDVHRQAGEEDVLRDPRRENTVRNLEHTDAQARADSRDLAEEDFAANTPARVEQVELNQLYLCELEKVERGIRLGLCLATKKGPLTEVTTKKGSLTEVTKVPTWTVSWFRITSRNGWQTKNIAFEPYKTVQKGVVTDNLEILSFRLHIEDSDLTKQGLANKASNPKFTSGFTDRVLAFARSEKLDEHDTEDEMDATIEESEDDEDAEEDGFEEEEEVSTQPAAVSNADATTRRGGARHGRGKRKATSGASDNEESPSERYSAVEDEQEEAVAASNVPLAGEGGPHIELVTDASRRGASQSVGLRNLRAADVALHLGALHTRGMPPPATRKRKQTTPVAADNPTSALPPVDPNSKYTIGLCGVCQTDLFPYDLVGDKDGTAQAKINQVHPLYSALVKSCRVTCTDSRVLCMCTVPLYFVLSACTHHLQECSGYVCTDSTSCLEEQAKKFQASSSEWRTRRSRQQRN